MIAGTIVLEDIIIHFACDSEETTVRVCDTLSGVDIEKKVAHHDFGKALYIALADPESVSEDIYGAAVSVVPTREEVLARLEQIYGEDEVSEEQAESIYRALRWIP